MKKNKVVSKSFKKNLKNISDTSLTAQLTDTERLFWIVCNPSTPGKILEELSTHTDVRIRIAVASHLQTPEYILKEILSKDEDSIVKQFAENTLKKIESAQLESVKYYAPSLGTRIMNKIQSFIFKFV